MKSGIRALGVGLASALLASTLMIIATEAPAAAVACDANGQLVWGAADCEIAFQNATVVVEAVSYPSPAGGADVNGGVCRRKAAGNYPILVLNHAGFSPAFSGGDYWLPTLCTVFASAGYLVIASDYRGFDAGNGDDVFCQGEVDDVLAMLDQAKDYPSADDDRVLMRGWSHGACITLRAYQQGVPGLVAAAAIAPPVDMDAQWQFFVDMPPSFWCSPVWLRPECGQYGDLQDWLENATGGTPATVPAEYASRSVNSDVDGLRDAAVPLLIAQGLNDFVVPPQLVCSMIVSANGLSGTPDFGTYHFESDAVTLTSASSARCPGHTWSTSPDPTATGFPASHYFFVVDGLDHHEHSSIPSSGPEWELMDHVNQFLLAKTPPP